MSRFLLWYSMQEEPRVAGQLRSPLDCYSRQQTQVPSLISCSATTTGYDSRHWNFLNFLSLFPNPSFMQHYLHSRCAAKIKTKLLCLWKYLNTPSTVQIKALLLPFQWTASVDTPRRATGKLGSKNVIANDHSLPCSCYSCIAGTLCKCGPKNTWTELYIRINIILGPLTCKWLSIMSPTGRKLCEYPGFLSWKCDRYCQRGGCGLS